jgi:hypothetical protein
MCSTHLSRNILLKHMKQSKVLTFTLIPIAISILATINIPSANAVKTGADADAVKGANAVRTGADADAVKGTNAVKTGADADADAVKGANAVKTGADADADAVKGANAVKTGADVDGKADNTIGFIGLGLSLLNSIGLITLFWISRRNIIQIQEDTSKLKSKISTQTKKVDDTEKSIDKLKKDRDESSRKTNIEIEGLKRSIEEISRKAASVQQSAPIRQSNNYGTGRQSSPSERYTPEPVNRQLSHTDYYNDRQSDFQNKYQITPVSREAENLNQSLAAQTDSVVLAGDRQGNYWLFSDNSEIYLVPKQNLKITDNRISTTKDLFECRDYTEQNYDNFVLIKPAVLVSQGNGNWQLKEKGKLQFG